ncbi:MAG: response regulator transcription factor [Deltaproteobacteria bacterium]|nr:response regulator transcription factor [Deltaproteobacteria bacterium]
MVSGERPSVTNPPGLTAQAASAPVAPATTEPEVSRHTPPGGLRAIPTGADPSLRRTQAWESAAAPLPPPVPSEAPDTSTDEIAPVAVPSSAPPPASLEEPTVRQPRRLRGEGARVLLVDDDPDLREIVGAMLEAVGLTVTVIGSAEEALELARGDAPDLLVRDWNLPGMSGLELCKVMRAHGPLAALPILFLTAHSATQDMVEAFAAGADDYVVKPFRAAELGARIFGLLRRTHGAVARP